MADNSLVPLDVHNTKSGIEGVQVTNLYYNPIEIDNRSLGVKFSNK